MPRPCSVCHRPSRDGLASVYWAWFPAPNTRVAFRTKLCVGCTSDIVIPLIAASPLDRAVSEDTGCASCGIDCGDDQNYLYATIYIPGHESTEMEAYLCGPCFTVNTSTITDNGYRLPDRDPVSRAPARENPAWAQLAG